MFVYMHVVCIVAQRDALFEHFWQQEKKSAVILLIVYGLIKACPGLYLLRLVVLLGYD